MANFQMFNRTKDLSHLTALQVQSVYKGYVRLTLKVTNLIILGPQKDQLDQKFENPFPLQYRTIVTPLLKLINKY